MMRRRDFLALGTLTTFSAATLPALLLAEPASRFDALPALFAQLEATVPGRLGVAVLDTASGQTSGYKADERFPMCSTFKLLLAAAVLQRIDHHQEQLDRPLPIPAPPLLPNSPLTGEHTGGHMTVAALCHAILTRSDNTGANLLLATVGGPAGLTRFARSLRDPVTRLDRTEPTLNQALPGDPRDTASPAATVANLRALLLGDALAPASRDRLIQWLLASQTGLARIRAGLPLDWRTADKTGTGDTTTNDIAVTWPPSRKPVILAAYLTQCTAPDTRREAVLAQVARLVAAALPSA